MERSEFTAGIVTWPGSNCDEDALRFFKNNGFNARFVYHTENRYRPYDILVLPGGFAYGDRRYQKATHEYSIDPGVQALETPVMEVIKEAAANGDKILGICNGFQILIHAGLLPGKLLQNQSGEFFCDDIECMITGGLWGDSSAYGQRVTLPVAHGFGRFAVSQEEFQEMAQNGQIVLKYTKLNPNGSSENIAGVSNKMRNIIGMMPHPERAELINYDGRVILEAIKKNA